MGGGKRKRELGGVRSLTPLGGKIKVVRVVLPPSWRSYIKYTHHALVVPTQTTTLDVESS